MVRLGILLAAAALLLSSCVMLTDLVVGNPCDHPIFVTTSWRNDATIAERDNGAANDREWLYFGVLGPGVASTVGEVTTATGLPAKVWVDTAGFSRVIDEDEIDSGPIWLDGGSCAAEDRPETMVLLQHNRAVREPNTIDVAGNSAVVDLMLASARPDDNVETQAVRVDAGHARINAWSKNGGNIQFSPFLSDLGRVVVYQCDLISCSSFELGDDTPALSYFVTESPKPGRWGYARLLAVAVVALVAKSQRLRDFFKRPRRVARLPPWPPRP